VAGWQVRSRTSLIILVAFSVCVGFIFVWLQGPDNRNASPSQLQQSDQTGKHADVLAPAPAPAGPAPAWSPGQTTTVETCDRSLGQIDTSVTFAGVFSGRVTEGQGYADAQVKLRRDGNVVRGSYLREGVCGTISGEVKGDQFLFSWNWASGSGRGIANQSDDKV
jgi:hypothetical protein